MKLIEKHWLKWWFCILELIFVLAMLDSRLKRLRTTFQLKCDTSKITLDSTIKGTPRTASEIFPDLTPATSSFIPETPKTAKLDGHEYMKRKMFKRKTIEPDSFGDSHMRSLKRKLTVLEEFGLPNDIVVKPGLKKFDSESSNGLSRRSITMADFWGNKVAQSLLSSPKLRQAANTLKHKYLIQNRATEHSLLYPNHPRKMDISTVIRVQNPNSSNSPVKQEIHKPLKTETTEPVFHTAKRMKKHRELSAIYQIMKSCDDLYKASQENFQKLNTQNSEEPKIKKLPRRDKEQIERFKKYLD
ncbi:unnamed protein product [Blepharisma stoltei]|uniref:Uncharacterized protein n=1 Tax=Blepharisma stoltei TaxID=1481888 RepID=A0AAU9ILF1_9CILI|nr:unnamed protein product [Blepharisma stoltei]